MTPRDFTAYLVAKLRPFVGGDAATQRRFVEACRDVAQVYAGACDLAAGCSCGETAEDRARGVEEVDGG